jgi:hypothetical protein
MALANVASALRVRTLVLIRRGNVGMGASLSLGASFVRRFDTLMCPLCHRATCCFVSCRGRVIR